ncbi:hypothetical protein B9Z19DRAFT_1086341 [Tuber borchii]|uniref:Uncharacterized protein n=1 Tax=Tuber borchii TaxID=42251 RepID=A0A2T6ZPQ2_TUBBO|nr:hypothetical protein B9Z19DRAFT_1086341 [Tuber borchii]
MLPTAIIGLAVVSIPPLQGALNQISNQITNDTGVPLDLEHAYTKLSDNAIPRSGGVLRMLLECRLISTFGGGSISVVAWGSH